jgi:hypothetical protein
MRKRPLIRCLHHWIPFRLLLRTAALVGVHQESGEPLSVPLGLQKGSVIFHTALVPYLPDPLMLSGWKAHGPCLADSFHSRTRTGWGISRATHRP